MYGTNAPRGLVPWGHLLGFDSWHISRLPLADGYATGLWTYDPIKSLGDGTMGIGVAGSPIRGIAMGFEWTDTDGVYQRKKRWPASTSVKSGTTPYVFVLDDPNILVSVQETNGSGAAGTALVAADINLNANFYVQSGDNTTGFSKVTLNNASEATTATLNLKIMFRDPHPDNPAVGTAFQNWICMLNAHELRGDGSTGV